MNPFIDPFFDVMLVATLLLGGMGWYLERAGRKLSQQNQSRRNHRPRTHRTAKAH